LREKVPRRIARDGYRINGTDCVSVRFPANHGEVVSIARFGRRDIMKTRTYVLGGVAALALAAAAPSFAQTAHDTGTPNDTGPQYSTPAEHAQTEQLNGQASQNGAAVNAQNSAQQTQYQQQQDQYQQSQERYQHQRAQYEHDIHHYDEARYYFTDYPHPYPYRYEGANLRKLYLIADPTHQLANAAVEGPDGQYVGRVRNVETSVDGRPLRVEVALNRRVSVWVIPDDLRFDAEDHVVFTHLSRADLWNMPGARYDDAM
jgi:hypothetical protein